MNLDLHDYIIGGFFLVALYILFKVIQSRREKLFLQAKTAKEVFENELHEEESLEIEKVLFFHKKHWVYGASITGSSEDGYNKPEPRFFIMKSKEKLIKEKNLIFRTGTLAFLKTNKQNKTAF